MIIFTYIEKSIQEKKKGSARLKHKAPVIQEYFIQFYILGELQDFVKKMYKTKIKHHVIYSLTSSAESSPEILKLKKAYLLISFFLPYETLAPNMH